MSTRKIATVLAILLAGSAGLRQYVGMLERRLASTAGVIQTVFSNPDFKDPPLLRRRVDAIDLSSLASPSGLPQRFFSVRWEGFWDIGARDAVDVYAGGDDRVRFFVDGQLAIERGTPNPSTVSRTLPMTEGVHSMTVEYVQDRGAAFLNVLWAPVGESARPFASQTLFVERPGAETLSAARRFVVVRRLATVSWLPTWIVAIVCVGSLLRQHWNRIRVHYASHAEQYARAGKIGVWAALAALTLSACLARLPGLDPESLWYDDLAWAAIARAQDLTSIFRAATHAPPGFLAMLWVFRVLFRDPEWSQQLLPFVCGIASVPVMAAAAWKLTRSQGLALLAAGLTALNPLLAHYTVFVKQYTLDFLVTALLILAAASMLDGREIDPRKLARLAILSGLGVLFSVVSIFVSLPTVIVVALRARLTSRHRGAIAVLSIGMFAVLLVGAYVLLRSRTRELMSVDINEALMRLHSPSDLLIFLATRGRRVVEMSLPSWQETKVWQLETVSWTLPFVGAGFIWLFARRSTRALGLIVLGFATAFLVASYTELYPLTTDRRSIFSFPVFICLFVMGLHLLTEWFSRREIVRTILGLAAVGFALYAPIRAEYWRVNDARLIQRVSGSLVPADGLILSPNGTYLAAYYGRWPVRFGAATESADGVKARIARELTLQLPPRGEPGPAVDRFLDETRPSRVWYVAFRTGGDEEEVLKALTDRAYELERIDTTAKGRLYRGVLR